MSNKRLTGAALHARIIKQVREDLAPWGLPMAEYDARIDRDGQWEGPYFEGGRRRFNPFPSHSVTLTHRETECEVVVTQIYTDNDGTIVQRGTQNGALTL